VVREVVRLPSDPSGPRTKEPELTAVEELMAVLAHTNPGQGERTQPGKIRTPSNSKKVKAESLAAQANRASIAETLEPRTRTR
jgi:hypothetical protein